MRSKSVAISSIATAWPPTRTNTSSICFCPRENFPVIMFVHGGAWRQGDKNFLGIYTALGAAWAAEGVGAVVTNYRLSPDVTHPEHERDVARFPVDQEAHQRVWRQDRFDLHLRPFGGRPSRRAAGDRRSISEEGRSGSCGCEGAIILSGVYRIPDSAYSSTSLSAPMPHCASRLRRSCMHIRGNRRFW